MIPIKTRINTENSQPSRILTSQTHEQAVSRGCVNAREKCRLNRMEMGAGVPDRYKKITYWKEGVDELLRQLFIEAHQQTPAELVPDIDTTDLPLHGNRKDAS